jgi:hypothetical protein
MTCEVKVTWLEHSTRNATCIGNDETVQIEADSANAACREAAEGHLYRYDADWQTGRYGLMAEHVGGTEVYGIEF